MSFEAAVVPIQQLNPRRRITLDNYRCPYCGVILAGGDSDWDHVIGKCFIPKGKLAKSWNLTVRSCRSCNEAKGKLEDELSALTMQPTAYGDYARGDALLRAEAARKGRGSTSRRTNKRVDESAEETEIRLVAPGFESTFSMVCGPQIDHGRASDLAQRQVRALFYWLTYNERMRHGGWWIDGFMTMQGASRPDWGNRLQRGFMEAVSGWNTRLIAVAADGYFKAIIRKGPTTTLWSWALEWNHSYRQIGFFGQRDEVWAVEGTLPRPVVQTIREPGCITRIRVEEALGDKDDKLFFVEGVE